VAAQDVASLRQASRWQAKPWAGKPTLSAGQKVLAFLFLACRRSRLACRRLACDSLPANGCSPALFATEPACQYLPFSV
jgi:hypothetical protein